MEIHNQHLASAVNIAAREEGSNAGVRQGEVTSNDIIYRVEEEVFKKELLVNVFVCMGWMGAIMVCIFMGFVDIANPAIPSALLPCAGAALSSVSFCVFAIPNRKLLSPLFVFSSAATAAYLVSATLLYGFSKNGQWIAAALFVAIQILLSLLFVQSKRNTVMVALSGLQLVLVGLKLDGVVTVSWSIVFLIFIMVAGFLLFAALILAVYGFVVRLRLGRFTADIVGVLYESVFLLGLGMCVGVVVGRVAFFSTSIYLGAPCIVFHALAILLFMYPFKEDIALYKAKAEILSIIDREVAIDKVKKDATLYMLSSQWFTLQEGKSKKRKDSLSSSQERQRECVVCLTDRADLVWMPCGHLTMCDSCGQYMLDHKKLECVVCKAQGEQIYHIDGQQPMNTNSCHSDHHYVVRII